jgi:hypothetical protein
MCYAVFLSTSSLENLAQHNNDLLRFKRETSASAASASLRYAQLWYIGSKSECSCTFRHLHSTELGFGKPVDWYPEDSDEINATRAVVQIIRRLVGQGHHVDCIDAWNEHDHQPPGASEMQVKLDDLDDEDFRFFENYYFDFVATARTNDKTPR